MARTDIFKRIKNDKLIESRIQKYRLHFDYLKTCLEFPKDFKVDKSKYNILFCSKKEKELLKKLKDETGKPDFVHIHYSDDDIKRTHNYFETIGIKPVSLMMCADTAVYGGAQVDEKLKFRTFAKLEKQANICVQNE